MSTITVGKEKTDNIDLAEKLARFDNNQLPPLEALVPTLSMLIELLSGLRTLRPQIRSVLSPRFHAAEESRGLVSEKS
jgi:hypothetical protein